MTANTTAPAACPEVGALLSEDSEPYTSSAIPHPSAAPHPGTPAVGDHPAEHPLC